MKTKLLIAGIVIGVSISLGSVVNAQLYIFQPSQGGTGTSTAPTYGQMLVGNAGGTYTLTATSSLGIIGDGIGNWFTPTGTYNATSTTLGFLNGFFSTASTTFSHLGTGGLAVNNGLLYNAATSTLSTITGTLATDKGGTGQDSSAWNGLAAINSGTWSALATSTISFGNASTTQVSATELYTTGFKLGTNNRITSFTGTGMNIVAGILQNTGVITVANNYPITWNATGGTGVTPTLAFGTTTQNTWGDTQTFSKVINVTEGTTATSTFSGNVRVVGNLQVDGYFFAPVTLVSSGDATINGALTVTGATTLATSLTGLLGLNSGATYAVSTTSMNASITGLAGTATALASDPSDCGANTWATAIATSGNLTCAAVTYAGITAMTSANFAGLISDETGTAGKVVFDTSPTLITPILGYASSTQLTVSNSAYLATTGGNVGIGTTTPGFKFSVNNLGSQFYINSLGRVVALDTTTGYEGVVSPLRCIPFTLATTTAWTATTSGSYIAQTELPFAGTIRTVRPVTNAGTLWLDVYHTSTHLPLIQASTTKGVISPSTNNTFTAGETLYVSAGTPASSPTRVDGTICATETP